MANYHPAFLLEVTIDSTNDQIVTSLGTVTVTNGTYTDMFNLMDTVVADMTSGLAGTFTYQISDVGIITIYRDSPEANYTITWTAANSIGTTLGFTGDDSGAYDYSGDVQHMYGFYLEGMLAFDSYDRKKTVGPGTFVAVSGKASRTTYGTQTERKLDIKWIANTKFFADDAATNEDFETFWEEASKGTPFAYYSSTDTGSFVDEGNWVLVVGEGASLIIAERLSPADEYYSISMEMIKQP